MIVAYLDIPHNNSLPVPSRHEPVSSQTETANDTNVVLQDPLAASLVVPHSYLAVSRPRHHHTGVELDTHLTGDLGASSMFQ